MWPQQTEKTIIYDVAEKMPSLYTWVLVHVADFTGANPWLVGFLRDDGRWYLNLCESVVNSKRISHWTSLPDISPEQKQRKQEHLASIERVMQHRHQ